MKNRNYLGKLATTLALVSASLLPSCGRKDVDVFILKDSPLVDKYDIMIYSDFGDLLSSSHTTMRIGEYHDKSCSFGDNVIYCEDHDGDGNIDQIGGSFGRIMVEKGNPLEKFVSKTVLSGILQKAKAERNSRK